MLIAVSSQLHVAMKKQKQGHFAAVKQTCNKISDVHKTLNLRTSREAVCEICGKTRDTSANTSTKRNRGVHVCVRERDRKEREK